MAFSTALQESLPAVPHQQQLGSGVLRNYCQPKARALGFGGVWAQEVSGLGPPLPGRGGSLHGMVWVWGRQGCCHTQGCRCWNQRAGWASSIWAGFAGYSEFDSFHLDGPAPLKQAEMSCCHWYSGFARTCIPQPATALLVHLNSTQ